MAPAIPIHKDDKISSDNFTTNVTSILRNKSINAIIPSGKRNVIFAQSHLERRCTERNTRLSPKVHNKVCKKGYKVVVNIRR